ncbi:alpha/beta hydrolase [Mycobacteroides salmoniphilum]|uniref:alpha/beta hydrolase n=1 Tax=Mycobacteroides salmoniphilum TaxID=404941 RepID=UPI003FEE8D68
MVVSVGENPFRADAVSWHVPGYSTTIDKIGGNLENARAHLESVWKEGGTKVSSIAWIGYDAPQGLFRGLWDVAHTKLASSGGDILHGDITAFNAARDVIAGDGSHFATNDIFAHSYGTTTSSFAGEGARLGNEVRSVTLAGSPGAGPIGKAADFGVGDKVFVASSSRDPVTMLGGRTADSAGRFFGKGLGFDPAMEGFGGQRVTAEFPQHMDHLSGKHGTVSTHTAYYKFDPILGVRTESLANFGRIGAGHFDQVHHEAPRTVDDRPGWQPGWRTDEPAAGRPLQLDHDADGHYSTDRRIWDPRWHEGYQEPGPGQAIAGNPEPPGPHSPPPHPDVPQHDADHPAGAGEFVEDRKHAAQDAGQIDDAGRVPVEELDSGERTRGWPYDDTGYRIREEDQKFVGIDDTQVGWWQRFEAPLGMTPEQFREFTGTMDEALVADGIDPALADIRLQGSSAQFFSGSHKDFPTEHDLAGQPDALARLGEWMGDRAEGDRPARIPFDAKYLLGVRDENGVLEPPSDYDVQFSSDAMVEKARQAWEAMDPEDRPRQFIREKYGFVDKDVVEEAFPGLNSWASYWEQQLGREVAPALFGSAGPPDKSGVGSGISTHFRDSDWIINRPGGPRR